MPWTATYGSDWAEVRYTGVTTGADILAAKSQFFAHRFDDAARFLLCDFTPVERFEVATAEVEEIVEQDRAVAAESPSLAEIVIAPTPIQYGLARMWQIRVANVRPWTAVVRTRDEARDWLAEHGIGGLPQTDEPGRHPPSSQRHDSHDSQLSH